MQLDTKHSSNVSSDKEIEQFYALLHILKGSSSK